MAQTSRTPSRGCRLLPIAPRGSPWLTALFLLLTGWALAAPQAGVVIANRADATFLGGDGNVARIQSNTVEAVVQAVIALDLRNDHTVTSAPGATLFLPHTVENTGNSPSVFLLELSDTFVGGFNLGNAALYPDTNRDGQPDSLTPITQTALLQPGETFGFVASARVPPGVATGQEDRKTVTARVPLPAAGGATVLVAADSNTDTVRVTAGATINVTKRFSIPSGPSPSSGLSVSIEYRNDGNAAATGFTIEDLIGAASTSPAYDTSGLRYVPGSARWSVAGATPLTDDGGGDPAGIDYTATTAGNVSRLSAVIADVPPGTSATLSFQVNVAGGVPVGSAQTHNAVAIRYNDGSQDRSAVSNLAIFDVTASATPDLAIEKTSRDVLQPLDIGFYDLRVRNRGSVATSGTITVTDELPAGLTFVAGQSGGGSWSCSPLGQRVSCSSDASVPAGADHPDLLTIAVRVDAALAGRTVTNVATVSGGGEPAASSADNRDDDDTVVGAQVNRLSLQKTPSRDLVELGDFLDYRIRLRNVGGSALADVDLTDRLPAGFRYVTGSSRLGGRRIADPQGAPGPTLVYNDLTDLAPNQSVDLTYRVTVGAGANLGDGINRATARSGGQVADASARVRIGGGVLDDSAYLIGKVYLDCNGNGVQDDDGREKGIPGVRLWLEDGTNVVTDVEGLYSLYGLVPRTHVLKVDPITLPPRSRLVPIANRNAFDGDTRFVDLKNGELHRADFAEGSCDEAVVKDVEARRRRFAANGESERALRQDLRREFIEPEISDPRARAAAGVVTGNRREGGAESERQPEVFESIVPDNLPAGGLSGRSVNPLAPRPDQPTNPSQGNFRRVLPEGTLDTRNSNLRHGSDAPQPRVDLEALLPGEDNQFGFIGLKDGDTMAYSQATIRLKGPQGARFKLTVNGREVSERRVGKRASLPSKQLEAWEFIGVALQPGENLLTAGLTDAFGNRRGEQTIRVIAPDALGKLLIEAPRSATADGHTPMTIKVRLTDAQGVPVSARTPVTLDSRLGRWQSADLDPRTPGTQVFVEGGVGEFVLLPPDQPGEDTIRVSSGVLRHQHDLDYVPELRPLIAAGLAEATLSLDSLDLDEVVPVNRFDSFEREIENFAFDDGGGFRGGARGALFLKGKVRGDYLLTLSYDSEKDLRDRLFRDIQPDQFYPIYGDSSVRGFDAQSTSRLYVRLDRGRNYILFGDFLTADQRVAEVRQITQYYRALNGLRGHYENERTSLNVFASFDDSRQIVREFRANGTSGPFFLNVTGRRINGEQIEIITRDRDQNGLVIRTQRLTRFTDYELEELTGRLLFRRPIPSIDENLNPLFIRVVLEVDQGGQDFWIVGFDGQVKLTRWLEVGGIYVRDENPAAPTDFAGVNATFRLTPRTYLVTEFATTDTGGEDPSQGDALRAELRHQDDRLSARVYAGRADPGFNNPTSNLSAGRVEAGAKATYKVTPRTDLELDALYSEDVVSDGSRVGFVTRLERQITDWLQLGGGVRHSTETNTPAAADVAGATPLDVTTWLINGRIRTPRLPASLFFEYEQDFEDSDRELLAIGGDYQIGNRGRLYARHEVFSSFQSAFALNNLQRNTTTAVGFEGKLLESTDVFSEYRIASAIDGRSGEAAIGLRNAWKLADGLTLHTTTERVQVLSGENGNQSQAYTAALSYTADPRWKGSLRAELRDGDDFDSFLITAGGAARLSPEWSLLSRALYSRIENDGGDDQNSDGVQEIQRYQIGTAWRDIRHNRWHALGLYEYRREIDTLAGDPISLGDGSGLPTRRNAHLLSFNANYQPSKEWIFAGRYAARFVADDSFGLRGTTDAHLLSARATHDLTRRLDLGLIGQTLYTDGADAVQYGLGVELGFLARKDLNLAIGYNFFGFRDEDLAGGDHTDNGVYFRVRYKFDEDLFKSLVGFVEER